MTRDLQAEFAALSEEDRQALITDTAYHEAGHAVVYDERGHSWASISISPAGDTLGLVTREPVGQRPMMPWDSTVTSAAGPVAQALFGWTTVTCRLPASLDDEDHEDCTFNDHISGAFLDGGSADLTLMHEAIEWVNDWKAESMPPLTEEAVLLETVKIVLRRWDATERLSRALLDHFPSPLSYEQCRAAIGRETVLPGKSSSSS